MGHRADATIVQHLGVAGDFVYFGRIPVIRVTLLRGAKLPGES